MARQVFFSFHYQPDNWRASQVRNIGAIEGSRPARDNDWETITRGGDAAIKRWIESQMHGRSCTVVLIGAATAGRKWINYEIAKTWNDRKGIVGIHVHHLLDRDSNPSRKGLNPFDTVKVGEARMSNIVRVYDPPFVRSKPAYAYIRENIEVWIEEAIEIRSRY